MEKTLTEEEKTLDSLYKYRTILEVIQIASMVIGFPALIILSACWGQKILSLLFETDGGLTATFLIVVLAIIITIVTLKKIDNLEESIRKLENKLKK